MSLPCSEDTQTGVSPSVIEILNLKSSKKLKRESYYRLNVKALKKAIKTDVTDSYLIRARYELPDDVVSLFNSTGELNDSEIQFRHINPDIIGTYCFYRFFLWEYGGYPAVLRVNNVGQGNHNEVLFDGGDYPVNIVYDIGASINAHKTDVQTLKENRIQEYIVHNPILVLSHWDFDHFHQLYSYTDVEIGAFSCVLCCNYVASMGSREMLKRLARVIPDRLFVIPVPPKVGKGSSKMLQIIRERLGSVYVGEYCKNKNYCGIALFIRGRMGIALLAGDCNMMQVSTILQNEVTTPFYDDVLKPLIMVVPHHGGEFNSKLRVLTIPSSVHPDTAVVSVDEKNNNYGHPKASMLNQLSSNGFNVLRTDKSCSDIILPF